MKLSIDLSGSTNTSTSGHGEIERDSLQVVVGAWIMMVLLNLILIVTTILVLVRRNKQPLKARSPLLMMVLVIVVFIVVNVGLARVVAGRDTFPCILYSALYMVEPMFAVPIILHTWRLYFIFKHNSLKHPIHKLRMKRLEKHLFRIQTKTQSLANVKRAASETTLSMTSNGSITPRGEGKRCASARFDSIIMTSSSTTSNSNENNNYRINNGSNSNSHYNNDNNHKIITVATESLVVATSPADKGDEEEEGGGGSSHQQSIHHQENEIEMQQVITTTESDAADPATATTGRSTLGDGDPITTCEDYHHHHHQLAATATATATPHEEDHTAASRSAAGLSFRLSGLGFGRSSKTRSNNNNNNKEEKQPKPNDDTMSTISSAESGDDEQFRKQLRLLSILVSDKLFALVIAVILLFNAVSFAIFLGLFHELRSFTHGCRNNRIVLFFAVIETAIFTVALLIGAILIIKIRDRFRMSAELFITFAILAVMVILFAVGSTIEPYRSHVELEYFPTGFIIFIGMTITTIVLLFIPAVMTFFWKHKNKRRSQLHHRWRPPPAFELEPSKKDPTPEAEKEDEWQGSLMDILEDTEFGCRQSFLKYCESEFAPESLLCYQDIERFRQLSSGSSKEKRAELLKTIEDTYIRLGSPLELNMSDGIRFDLQARIAANASEESIDNVLGDLERVLIPLLEDTFFRYSMTKQYEKLVKSVRMQKKLLSQTGMV